MRRSAGVLVCFAALASTTLVACAALLGLSEGNPADGTSFPTGDGGVDGAPCSDPAACGDASIVEGGADPKNCGRPGHDCLGGACIDGLCQPFRVSLPSDGGAPPVNALAVGDGGAIFGALTTEGGGRDRALFACQRPACTAASVVTPYVQEVGARDGLAVDGDAVYFVEAYTDGQGRVSLCTAASCVDVQRTAWVDFSDVPTGALALGNGRIFLAEQNPPGSPGLRGCDRPRCQVDAGPSVAPFNVDNLVPTALAAAGTELYFSSKPGTLEHCNASGATCSGLTTTAVVGPAAPILGIEMLAGLAAFATASSAFACPRPDVGDAGCAPVALASAAAGFVEPIVGISGRGASIAVARKDGVYVCATATAASCAAPQVVARFGAEGPGKGGAPGNVEVLSIALDDTTVYIGTSNGLYVVAR